MSHFCTLELLHETCERKLEDTIPTQGFNSMTLRDKHSDKGQYMGGQTVRQQYQEGQARPESNQLAGQNARMVCRDHNRKTGKVTMGRHRLYTVLYTDPHQPPVYSTV